MACNSLWSFGQDRQQGQQETLASKFSFLAATAPKPTTKFVHINGSPKQPGKGSSRQKQKVSNCEPQIVSNLMKAGKKSVPKTGHEAISNLKSGTTHFTNLVELKKKKTRRSFVNDDSSEYSMFSDNSIANDRLNHPEHVILDEATLDELIHMQQQEVLKLVQQRKIFDIHDEVASEVYSHQYQSKVAEYLVDGGSVSITAKRLNIDSVALKAWKNRLVEAKMKKKKAAKQKKERLAMPKAKAVKPPKKIKKQRKSLEGEEVEVMKTRSSEKKNQNLDTAIEKEGPGKGKRGRAKKSQKGADKLSDVMEVDSTKGTDALNEDFLILDKDASVHSSEESMLSYDEIVLEARRRQLEETNETKVSLFVCNSCREIFRSTVDFLNHERNCEKFIPVPFTKVQ
ncbi:uncharacterized protein LOC134848172 [Symsagittifera roscoffensis]|uniref:uncharacterized protein LOC134848172 n=1 Tax=Symsagittifera roscoffensis TaxID=84072 RepID=UPI00307BD7EC